MKKMINYYYKLFPQKIYGNKKTKYFFDDTNKYYIEKIEEKNVKNILKIYDTLKNKNIPVNRVIKNTDGNYVTKYDNESYIIIIVEDLENLEININDLLLYNIDIEKDVIGKFEIDELEEMKHEIDYYENLFAGYNNEYKDVQNLLNYYFGLAENAVSYLSDTVTELGVGQKKLCHKSINDDLTNKCLIDILNFNYNYRLKDVVEYFKIKINGGSEWVKELDRFLKKEALSEFDYRYLYCGIMYPNYFFKYVEQVINNKSSNDNLNYSVDTKQNESNIETVYTTICKYCKIPSVWWLNEKKT